MIDVTFLLLVFFLCTLQFKTLDGKLAAYLPRDHGAGPPTEAPEPVRVGIRVLVPGTLRARPGGRHDFGADRVVEYRVGPHRVLDRNALRDRLERLSAAGDERPAVITPGSAVSTGEVVGVLDTLLEAGYSRIAFGAAR